jgi:hypothetical protein
MLTRTVQTATVQLPGNRTFEASLYRSADGSPLDLVLSCGFNSEANGWRAHGGTIALPPGCLADIRAALAELEGNQ